MRKATVERHTKETQIIVELNIDGSGKTEVKTGLPFFDHMLETLARHSHIDMKLKAQGDLDVDPHHTVEDSGIAFGQALKEALGEKRMINRYGFGIIPMDESLSMAAIDISGRPHLSYEADLETELIGHFSTDLVPEFLIGFVNSSGITLHLKNLSGKNPHHKIESMFKALAKALEMAISLNVKEKNVPSTKGVIE